jgi:hypothetical protein
LLVGTLSCGSPKINVTVPNVRLYSVAGHVTDGAIWADTEDALTGAITDVALVELLEASDGSDPANPKHAASVILTTTDYESLITAFETACLDLGKYCTTQIKSNIAKMRSVRDRLRGRSLGE